MNCGDCILLRTALRSRRNRLLFAKHIRDFRAFSRSKNLTAVYAHRMAKETQFYGRSSARTSAHFSAMFFRKTRKISADVQAYSERNLTQYCGKASPNLCPFFGDVFSQDKENERRRTSVLQAKFDAVLRKSQSEPQFIFRRCFSQDKASKPPLYTHTARRKKRSFTGNSARTSDHFSVMFFRKTRKMSDGVLSVLRAKFDAVLRKSQPEPLPIFRRCFFARQGF